MDDITKAIGSIVLFIANIYFGLFAFTKVWHWIAVPILGVHDVSMLQAWGLAIVFGFFANKSAKEDEKSFSEKMLVSIGCHAISLGLAYAFFA